MGPGERRGRRGGARSPTVRPAGRRRYAVRQPADRRQPRARGGPAPRRPDLVPDPPAADPGPGRPGTGPRPGAPRDVRADRVRRARPGRRRTARCGVRLAAFQLPPRRHDLRHARAHHPYRGDQLNLRSTDRRNDALVIVVILVVESIVEVLTVSSAFFDLSPTQMLIGAPLAFVLYFAGTVLPTMIFIYAILLPRFVKLTGSAVTAAILGGVAYTLAHFLDAWLVFSSASAVLLSVIFLFFQYFGPGLIKSVLTLRTGNAWVHAIAYHSVAPHVLVDGPHVVHVFGVK